MCTLDWFRVWDSGKFLFYPFRLDPSRGIGSLSSLANSCERQNTAIPNDWRTRAADARTYIKITRSLPNILHQIDVTVYEKIRQNFEKKF